MGVGGWSVAVFRVKSDDGADIAAAAADNDVIGVQDQTYRHSWPNSEVIVSSMEGGRNEDENSMRDAVFQFKVFLT